MSTAKIGYVDIRMLESKYPYLHPLATRDRLRIVDQSMNPAIQSSSREKTERIRAILLAQPFNDLTPVKFENDESIRRRDNKPRGDVVKS